MALEAKLSILSATASDVLSARAATITTAAMPMRMPSTVSAALMRLRAIVEKASRRAPSSVVSTGTAQYNGWRNGLPAAPGTPAAPRAVTRTKGRWLAAGCACDDPCAMRFVALEEARAATGVKLVVAASLPSPWSEAAKGILHVKGIDALLVRFSSSDTAVREWMGWHNVPVLLAPDE